MPSPTASQALQQHFASRIAAECNRPWDRIHIVYEHFPWEDDTVEHYVAESFLEDRAQAFDPSLEALDLLIELKRALGAESGRDWSHVDFRMDRRGFAYAFGHEAIPPLWANLLRLLADPRAPRR